MNIGGFVYLFIPMKYVILVGRKKFSGDPSIEAIPQETDPDSVSTVCPFYCDKTIIWLLIIPSSWLLLGSTTQSPTNFTKLKQTTVVRRLLTSRLDHFKYSSLSLISKYGPDEKQNKKIYIQFT